VLILIYSLIYWFSGAVLSILVDVLDIIDHISRQWSNLKKTRYTLHERWRHRNKI